ncbi:unnamed protein product, partial [marine sediment metagenome]
DRIRNGRGVGIPEYGIAVKPASSIGGIGPGNIDGVVAGRGAYCMAGALYIAGISRRGSIDKERPQVDGGLPVTGIIHAPDVEVVAVPIGQGRAGASLYHFLDVLDRIRNRCSTGVPED